MIGEEDRIGTAAGAAALQQGCTNMGTTTEFRELVKVTEELAAGQGGNANTGKRYVEE
jgi:hypothetical protein